MEFVSKTEQHILNSMFANDPAMQNLFQLQLCNFHLKHQVCTFVSAFSFLFCLILCSMYSYYFYFTMSCVIVQVV